MLVFFAFPKKIVCRCRRQLCRYLVTSISLPKNLVFRDRAGHSYHLLITYSADCIGPNFHTQKSFDVRKLALVLVIPKQILFSFSSDKDRRTDSRIIREKKQFFRLIRLSVLLSLSELKEKRICLVLMFLGHAGTFLCFQS